jgi:DNA excision repair protein ERCC-5
VQRIAKRGKGSISAQTTLLPYFDHAVTGAMSVSYAPRRRTTANLSKRLMSVIKAFREAEAGASVAWGEMLAGVDENDPKGSGVGKSTGKGKGKAKEGEGGVGEGEGEGEDTGESEGTRKGKRKAAAKGKAKGRGKSIASTEAEENGEAEDADADAQPKPRKKPAKRAAKRKPADEDTYGSDPEAAPKRRRVTRTATGSSATPATEGE